MDALSLPWAIIGVVVQERTSTRLASNNNRSNTCHIVTSNSVFASNITEQWCKFHSIRHTTQRERERGGETNNNNKYTPNNCSHKNARDLPHSQHVVVPRMPLSTATGERASVHIEVISIRPDIVLANQFDFHHLHLPSPTHTTPHHQQQRFYLAQFHVINSVCIGIDLYGLCMYSSQSSSSSISSNGSCGTLHNSSRVHRHRLCSGFRWCKRLPSNHCIHGVLQQSNRCLACIIISSMVGDAAFGYFVQSSGIKDGKKHPVADRGLCSV